MVETDDLQAAWKSQKLYTKYPLSYIHSIGFLVKYLLLSISSLTRLSKRHEMSFTFF